MSADHRFKPSKAAQRTAPKPSCQYLLLLIVATFALAETSVFADPAVQSSPPDISLPAQSKAARPVPGVTVMRKTDPLSRSDRHLARTKKFLPSTGSDIPPSKDNGDRVRDYVAAHADPNTSTGEQREMMQRANNLPPGPIPNHDAQSEP